MKYLNHFHSILNDIVKYAILLHSKAKGGLLMATEAPN